MIVVSSIPFLIAACSEHGNGASVSKLPFMEEPSSDENIPPRSIEQGMNEIQPLLHYPYGDLSSRMNLQDNVKSSADADTESLYGGSGHGIRRRRRCFPDHEPAVDAPSIHLHSKFRIPFPCAGRPFGKRCPGLMFFV
ncbi:MAG TPA: hypothetical protein PLO63_07160 [Syntrophales bacterium]|nr:hypothetical protein [Syntrophales bacterium]